MLHIDNLKTSGWVQDTGWIKFEYGNLLHLQIRVILQSFFFLERKMHSLPL